MVDQPAEVFGKVGVDTRGFQPNYVAISYVYYAKFLTQGTNSTKHWLNRRYCCGLRQYVHGHEIEPRTAQQEHLASQCLPYHFNGSGASQPAGLEQSGQAIASAPVVCELWILDHQLAAFRFPISILPDRHALGEATVVWEFSMSFKPKAWILDT